MSPSRVAMIPVLAFVAGCSSRCVGVSSPDVEKADAASSDASASEVADGSETRAVARPDGSNRLAGDRGSCPSGFTELLTNGHHTSFLSAGQQRSFDLLLPPDHFTGVRPLLFTFHGTGLTGARAIDDYRLEEWVNAGFIVVAPDSNGNGTLWPVWDAFEVPAPQKEQPRRNADLALFDDLLRCVASHHPVDARRVFVGGQSAGGAMTNFVLGRRSSIVAGGIAASGAFDLTQPTPKTPIDPISVIVTWGGANDVYSGSAGSASVSNVGYAEQSAIASQYWAKQPGSQQIACRGSDLGHVWLGPINAWMRDVLLAHPKGSAKIAGWSLPSLPAGAPVSCSEEAATYKSPVTVSCPASPTAGCRQYCQMIGSCLVENGTLGPTMADELRELGYSNSTNVCSGCVTSCEADARRSPADSAVLACLAIAAPSTTCGPGYAGAAAFDTVGKCCKKSASKVCSRFCGTFGKNPRFAPLLSGCP